MSDTQPTPETDRLQAFAPVGFVWQNHARKLEHERNEAREELARLQTMAASVADVIAKRDAMLDAIRWAHDALKELRSFYIETTGLPPCAANAALTKLKPFLP